MKALWRRLALLLKRDRFRAELEEEMAFHRAEAEEQFVAEGASAQAARNAAKRQFGNETRVREQSHEAIGFRFESIGQDVRYALRQMRRAPGFTIAVVLTLALGIGATTAIFSVVHATLLRPLPYPDAGRIITIKDQRLHGDSTGGLVTVPRYFDLKMRSRSLESISCYYFQNPSLLAGGRGAATGLPQQVNSVTATGDFWRVLGVGAWMGRTFDAHDDSPQANEVVVLSYLAWRRYLGADPGVIGKVVEIDRKPATVIGVMPPSFHYPSVSEGGTDIWLPTRFNPANWNSYRGDGVRFVNLVGRLKPGVAFASAQSDLQAIGGQLGREFPETDGPWQFVSRDLRDQFYGELRPALLVLLTASAVLLLIGCLNVANLMLSRATSRRREVALRQALGASRGRLLRQLLTESTLLAVFGGIAGLVSASVLLRAATAELPAAVHLDGTVGINLQVVCFALGISLAAGIVFGLAPAFDRRSGDLNRELKSHMARTVDRASNRVRNAFISVQVGLSLMLLVAACLLAQSLWKLTRSPLGFVAEHVLTFKIDLPWGTTPTATDSFYSNVQNRLESLPGVLAVGQTSALPTEDWHARGNFDVDWMPRTAHKDAATAELRNLDGNYLGAMGIPLLAGRALRPGDAKAVLVNAEFVRRYLPNGNIVGRHMLGGEDEQIVGVIGDVRGTSGSIASAIGPEVYYPASGLTKRSIAVRTSMDPELLVAAIRRQVHEADSQQAVGSIHTLDQMLSIETSQPRLNMALLVSFAAVALSLACVGIYGVVAYSVAQRRQEIGVRMALGASRWGISRMFLRRTLTYALIGLACGGVGTVFLMRLLRSQLYGVRPNDPVTFLIATVLLLVPVFAASLRPALRAATVDPAEALRAE
jgi:predicted permease